MKDLKMALRKEMKARRAAAFASDPDAGERLAAQVADWPDVGIVAGYSAFRQEIDPVPLMRAFAARGAELALPVLTDSLDGMIFRSWHPASPLIEGPFGLLQPPPESPEVLPDLVLVPLLAFDRQGRRLGYGGGFYDRGLYSLRTRKPFAAWGIAWAAQEVHALPHEPHDQRLDAVLTEKSMVETRTD